MYISARAAGRCQPRMTRRRPRASPTVMNDRVRCSVRTTPCQPWASVKMRLGMVSPPAFDRGAIADVLTIAASRPHGPRETPGSVPGLAGAHPTGATARRRSTAAVFDAHLSSGTGGREVAAAAGANRRRLCGERLMGRGP